MKSGSWTFVVRTLLVLVPLAALGRFAFGKDVPKDTRSAAPSDNASIAAGEKLFVMYCQTCHGKTGHGDGPAAAALKPKPRDFSTPKNFKSKNDHEVFELISKGGAAEKLSPAMPAWGAMLKKEQIWQLIAYIRGFPARDSLAHLFLD